jgi:S1-C subfamily serine protease
MTNSWNIIINTLANTFISISFFTTSRWVAAQPFITAGQKVIYTGTFTNKTYSSGGIVTIEATFEQSNKVSGYINFTNNPGGRTICGAGNFHGTVKDRVLTFRFISNDPDPNCGWDQGLAFTVNATLSSEGNRLQNGIYQIDNAQAGIFEAFSQTLTNKLAQRSPSSNIAKELPIEPPKPPVIESSTSASNVYKIANKTTILINGKDSGSGVIISRNGNTYYLLTAKHVINFQDRYIAVTFDSKKYPLDYSKIIKLPDIDLAIAQFDSKENLSFAQLGDSKNISPGDLIYVSGWPAVDQAITKPSHLVTEGKIAGIQASNQDGYELMYNNATGPGMSGGAIFNNNGQLVGIHGRAAGNAERGKTGINLGIPIHLFLRKAQLAGLNLKGIGLKAEK